MTKAIDELFALVAEAGGTVRLHGKPVTAPELEAVCEKNVVDRIAASFAPTHYWRVKTRLPERFGMPCWVTARGAMNSCRVIFEDGYEVITSRNFVRKRKP